jgi:hypothetical protein
MTKIEEKIVERILELEHSIVQKSLQTSISVSNLRRGTNCWIADITLDDEVTIHGCEYPDKYFKDLEEKCATNQ